GKCAGIFEDFAGLHRAEAGGGLAAFAERDVGKAGGGADGGGGAAGGPVAAVGLGVDERGTAGTPAAGAGFARSSSANSGGGENAGGDVEPAASGRRDRRIVGAGG